MSQYLAFFFFPLNFAKKKKKLRQTNSYVFGNDYILWGYWGWFARITPTPKGFSRKVCFYWGEWGISVQFFSHQLKLAPLPQQPQAGSYDSACSLRVAGGEVLELQDCACELAWTIVLSLYFVSSLSSLQATADSDSSRVQMDQDRSCLNTLGEFYKSWCDTSSEKSIRKWICAIRSWHEHISSEGSAGAVSQ